MPILICKNFQSEFNVDFFFLLLTFNLDMCFALK